MPFLMSEKSLFQLELNWFNRKCKEFFQYTYTDTPILWKSENLLMSCLNYLFIYLAVPGLSCKTWDGVPGPGIEPGQMLFTGLKFPVNSVQTRLPCASLYPLVPSIMPWLTKYLSMLIKNC